MARLAVAAAQVATPVGPVVTVLQVVVVYRFVELAVAGVQDATGVGPVVTLVQVVVV